MNKTLRFVVPGIAAAAMAASLTACGSSSTSTGGSSTGGGSSSGIAGGGSSAQEKAQTAWRAGAGTSATFTYDSVGSGTGRTNFISGAYKYAGTDSALKDSEVASATKTCGAAPIEIPVFISPIDVIFNLSGVSKLNLNASVTAKIFSGKITKWNDSAIAALNPGVTLPSTAITPVHRSDSSGTTANFTDYLNKAAPADWSAASSSDWPTTSGESAKGTSGVVGDVQAGNGTIGYADDSGVQGTTLGVALIKVGGTYVKPSAAGAAAALSASKEKTGTPASILTYSLNRTSTDASTYPIFMASYEIACQHYADASTAADIKKFLTFVTSDPGQQAAAANAYSAPLPAAIAAKEAAIIAKIN